MRFSGLLFLVILFAECGDSRRDDSRAEGISPDTLYDGNFPWREKRGMIRIDDSTDGTPNFSVGDTSFLRIITMRLRKYELLVQPVGATVIKVDTADHWFKVIPNDKSFSLIINQSFPKGRVVRCTRNWNKDKQAFDEQITEVEGLVKISSIDFVAQQESNK